MNVVPSQIVVSGYPPIAALAAWTVDSHQLGAIQQTDTASQDLVAALTRVVPYLVSPAAGANGHGRPVLPFAFPGSAPPGQCGRCGARMSTGPGHAGLCGPCQRTQVAGPNPERCRACNTWVREGMAYGPYLTPNVYCRPCGKRLARSCMRRHQRLPLPGEFWCRGCKRLCSLADTPRPDPDGRRRWRCLECRKAEVRAAELRRGPRVRRG